MFPYTSCDLYDKKIVLANYAFNGMPNALLNVTPTPRGVTQLHLTEAFVI